MIDFFNDFEKVNEKENPKPEPEKQDAGGQAEEKEENTDFSKTLESLRNEITALKELLKNSSMGNSAGDAENENKTESEEKEEWQLVRFTAL